MKTLSIDIETYSDQPLNKCGVYRYVESPEFQILLFAYKEAIDGIEGVRYLSPHSCRHTYVSQMQALGVDLSTIQSIVGHADVDMTQHYLHVQDGIRQEAIHKFAQAFPLEDIPPEDPETGSCRVIRFPHVG